MSLTLNGTTGVDGLTNLGVVTSTGSDTARTLANRFADVVNVLDFGAYNNGTHATETTADARIHVGVIAQEVVSAFQSEGLDATKYGLLCYDEWDEQPEEKDFDGNVIQQYRPAGNRYGIRYDQLLAFIISAI
jgi:hypothetical protein